MKYEIDTGLTIDRSQNDIEKNYFKLNAMSARGYRRYIYIHKKKFAIALSRIVRVDVVFNTSFSIDLMKSKKNQDLYKTVWTFETEYKNRKYPFLFPKNYKFDDNLLKSPNFIGPEIEISKFKNKVKELSEGAVNAKLPNIKLNTIYFDRKEEWENIRPILSIKGWKLADIDYSLDGNSLFKKSL